MDEEKIVDKMDEEVMKRVHGESVFISQLEDEQEKENLNKRGNMSALKSILESKHKHSQVS